MTSASVLSSSPCPDFHAQHSLLSSNNIFPQILDCLILDKQVVYLAPNILKIDNHPWQQPFVFGLRLHPNPCHTYIQRVWKVGGRVGVPFQVPSLEIYVIPDSTQRKHAKQCPLPRDAQEHVHSVFKLSIPKRTNTWFSSFPVFLPWPLSRGLGKLSWSIGIH